MASTDPLSRDGAGTETIRFRDVSFRYPGAKSAALDSVSLTLHRGDMAILSGRSGSGKSTLALCLKGFIPHQLKGEFQGRIEVFGLDTRKASIAELALHVGLVMQDPEVQLCNLTVRDEVLFGPENEVFDRERCRRNLAEALDQVGLSGFEDRSIHALSGGEKQRLAIASVLAMEPELIVFDEPTANLDPLARREVAALMARLREAGRTLIVVQHELDDFLPLANRLVVMNQGRVVADGEPRQVLDEWGSRLTTECGLGLPQLAAAALELGRTRFSQLPLTVEEFADTWPGLAPASTNSPTPHPARLIAPRPVMAREPLVQLQRVSYAYEARRTAIDNVSLSILSGEVVAIVGRNGAGKSTLARMMVGLRRPVRGQVLIRGRDLRRYAPNARHGLAGFVFQYPEHQFVTTRVYDEVAFGLEVRGLPADQVRERVAHALGALGLAGLEDRHPFMLSGGEKRRLSVATMLVLRPPLLVLDEPSYAQDEGNLRTLVGQIFELARTVGTTIVFVTHDILLVARYASRLIALEGGRVLFDGAPKTMFGNETLLRQAGLVPTPIMTLTAVLAARGNMGPVGSVTFEDLVQAVQGDASPS